MRIVSLLPSATDIVVALGAGDQLVGVSHSCSGDWDHLPKLTSTWIDTGASATDIDAQVRSAARPLYELDLMALENLAPDVVISQSLCDVCAVPSGDVEAALAALGSAPSLVDLTPFRLHDVPACFRQVGAAINRSAEAKALTDRWHTVLRDFRGRHAAASLRIAFLDWLDPPFAAGHWVPDMLEWLGTESALARPGEPSHQVSWHDVSAAHPDLIIAACCGFDQARVDADQGNPQLPLITLDGLALFSRPSPALLPSLALLSATISRHQARQ